MGAISHMGDMIGATPPIDDSSVSDKTLWSSQKTKEEIDAICEVQTVAFTMASGMTNFSNRTRINKNGNVITANICVAPSAAVGNTEVDILTLTDASLAPSNNVGVAGVSNGALMQVTVYATGRIGTLLRLGTHGRENLIYATVTWTVGK